MCHSGVTSWPMRINAALLVVLAAGGVSCWSCRTSARAIATEAIHGANVGVQSTQQPTAGPMNWSNCLIVMPDGRIHLELHRQELFGSVALTAYESALDSNEIGILRSILDDGGIVTLPSFPSPVTPMDVDDWQVFTAEIVREAQVQQVGYLAWHGKGPNNPEPDKEAWREAHEKLQRLVAWSHEVKSRKALKWRQVGKPKTWCGQ